VRLGFLTAVMSERPLGEVVAWARANGFAAVEIAAWPAGERSHTAAHLDLSDLGRLAEEVPQLLAQHGVRASALAFYENNLDHRPEARAAHHAHLRRCIDAAAAIGCPAVGTFVGRNLARTIADSLAEAEAVFPPLVAHAAERGVELLVENCVMQEWDPDRHVGNLAHTPELWEWMGGLGLRLNFDPSHLVWQGIDPVAALRGALPLVAHVHAKDVELFPTRRNRTGWAGPLIGASGHDGGWWRFRMPGLGVVDWRGVLDALAESGFEGTLSIEHEDPVWGGDPGRVDQGLRYGRATLAALMPELAS
jgi:sugar phosphate isomerase/epimerase